MRFASRLLDNCSLQKIFIFSIDNSQFSTGKLYSDLLPGKFQDLFFDSWTIAVCRNFFFECFCWGGIKSIAVTKVRALSNDMGVPSVAHAANMESSGISARCIIPRPCSWMQPKMIPTSFGLWYLLNFLGSIYGFFFARDLKWYVLEEGQRVTENGREGFQKQKWLESSIFVNLFSSILWGSLNLLEHLSLQIPRKETPSTYLVTKPSSHEFWSSKKLSEKAPTFISQNLCWIWLFLRPWLPVIPIL